MTTKNTPKATMTMNSKNPFSQQICILIKCNKPLYQRTPFESKLYKIDNTNMKF